MRWAIAWAGLLLTAASAGSAAGAVMDVDVWINELHYDNEGADQGEFVEVVAPLGLNDLGSISLSLYNGANGGRYGGTFTLEDFTPGESTGGFRLYSLQVAGLQNGAPDGLALTRSGGQVLQFLSYEGVMTAVEGPAAGLESTDLGVSESGSTPVGFSLQLIGAGDSYGDFTWSGPAAASPGAANSGQQLTATAVPEPPTLVLTLALAAAAAAAAGVRYLRACAISAQRCCCSGVSSLRASTSA